MYGLNQSAILSLPGPRYCRVNGIFSFMTEIHRNTYSRGMSVFFIAFLLPRTASNRFGLLLNNCTKGCSPRKLHHESTQRQATAGAKAQSVDEGLAFKTLDTMVMGAA